MKHRLHFDAYCVIVREVLVVLTLFAGATVSKVQKSNVNTMKIFPIRRPGRVRSDSISI